MIQINSDQLSALNEEAKKKDAGSLERFREEAEHRGHSFDKLVDKVAGFQIAVPSWALGTGGTRFGRFSIGGEPRNLFEKLDDIGLLHQLTRQTDAVSLHIPWDIPDDTNAVRAHAGELGIGFDAMNNNTFQDYGQPLSYKMGSFAHCRPEVRRQAIDHTLEVIRIGRELGSKGLTIWLADGTNFPGQGSFRKQFNNTLASLEQVYSTLPKDWKLLLEYKPYEPNFYSTVIPDWGTSLLLCNALGDQAKVLVDLGHHLPNTNIEQIVATLLNQEMLAGFHFNDSKYGDDDLTAGSIKPYQLFLLFCELVFGTEDGCQDWDSLSWMIDASHNTKDPVEDLMQALEAIATAYAKALMVDREKLTQFQEDGDVVGAQEVLSDAFQTDVRMLIRAAREQSGGAWDPIGAYRAHGIREKMIKERGKSRSTGL